MPCSLTGDRRQRCLELSDEPDELLFAEGYDDALLGVGSSNGEEIVLYDAARVVRILHRRDGMPMDEAEEFFEYNVLGAWVGDRTPMFVRLVGR